jgi:prenyltransferase beta subunit
MPCLLSQLGTFVHITQVPTKTHLKFGWNWNVNKNNNLTFGFWQWGSHYVYNIIPMFQEHLIFNYVVNVIGVT